MFWQLVRMLMIYIYVYELYISVYIKAVPVLRFPQLLTLALHSAKGSISVGTSVVCVQTIFTCLWSTWGTEVRRFLCLD